MPEPAATGSSVEWALWLELPVKLALTVSVAGRGGSPWWWWDLLWSCSGVGVTDRAPWGAHLRRNGSVHAVRDTHRCSPFRLVLGFDESLALRGISSVQGLGVALAERCLPKRIGTSIPHRLEVVHFCFCKARCRNSLDGECKSPTARVPSHRMERGRKAQKLRAGGAPPSSPHSLCPRTICADECPELCGHVQHGLQAAQSWTAPATKPRARNVGRAPWTSSQHTCCCSSWTYECA
jgi:hypothetical protein